MENVLIADDSELIRLNIKKIVEQIGHTVVAEAENGVDAIDKFKQFAPSVVTLDIIMPKMNGLQALQKLMEINPDVKVLIVTAIAHEPIIKKTIKMGALSFVIKPFRVGLGIPSLKLEGANP